MDEKLIENIEKIAGNVDDLLYYLEQKENKNDNIDIEFVDTLNSNFSTYNKLLTDIKISSEKHTQLLTGYLERLDNIEEENVDIDLDLKNNENLNNDIELENFTISINELLSKFDDLKNVLENLNIEYDLNIDDDKINNLKRQLETGLIIDINVNDLEVLQSFKNSLVDLENNFNFLEDITNIIDFSDWLVDIENIKNVLMSISEMSFDNINLNILNIDNINEILDKIDKLKNIEISLDIKNNIEDIETSLTNIKNIDIQNNIDLIKDKIDNLNNIELVEINFNDNFKNNIENIISELNNISTIDIDLKLKENIYEKFSNIQTELTNFVSTLPPLMINTEIDIKTDNELFIENLEDQLDNVNITITPNIDLSDEIERLNNEIIDIKLNPNIEIDSSNISIVDNTPNIQTGIYNDTNEKMLLLMEQNNMILQTLNEQMGLFMKKESKVETIDNISNIDVISDTTSIAKVSPKKLIDNESQEIRLLKDILSTMQNMSSINQKLLIEQIKSKFKDDLNL